MDRGEGLAVAIVAAVVVFAGGIAIVRPHGAFDGPFDASAAFWWILAGLAFALVPLLLAPERERGAARVVVACALAVGALGWYASSQAEAREFTRIWGAAADLQPMTKGFAAIAILCVILAAPIAFGEGWSDRRFRRAEQELHAARSWRWVAPYAGPEGNGTLFQDGDEAILLLRPEGGLGAPRRLAVPARAVPIEHDGATSPVPMGRPGGDS